jgi:hypothetical protein
MDAHAIMGMLSIFSLMDFGLGALLKKGAEELVKVAGPKIMQVLGHIVAGTDNFLGMTDDGYESAEASLHQMSLQQLQAQCKQLKVAC